MWTINNILNTLTAQNHLSAEEWAFLFTHIQQNDHENLFARARTIQQAHYGHKVYMRGLIEISNFCKNDCLYCGIRKSNLQAPRYRLTTEEILDCCEQGYDLGFHTFVLQGGEDPHFTEERVIALIHAIKSRFPDCALTLSLGEKPRSTYQAFYNAGANRYLLRHETADPTHYSALHPASMSWQNRIDCLHNLREIGFQTGCGFMAGSPHQTTASLVQDMLFMQDFKPHMVGIGPFIPHDQTPFAAEPAGSLALTLLLLAFTRLMLPSVLLPATTALASLHPEGRELGILAGANVVMPNLSPRSAREKYQLYNNKAHTGAENAHDVDLLRARLAAIGYELSGERGDFEDG